MDKHICKAKDLNTGKWIYGYYVALPDEYTNGKDIVHAIFTLDCEHVCMGEYKDIGWHEVDPETVCLCTRKVDKNNKPIFENDIVVSKANIPMLIRWDDVCASFDVVYRIDGVGWCSNIMCDSERLEIIGNKFDNTELMEVIK